MIFPRYIVRWWHFFSLSFSFIQINTLFFLSQVLVLTLVSQGHHRLFKILHHLEKESTTFDLCITSLSDHNFIYGLRVTLISDSPHTLLLHESLCSATCWLLHSHSPHIPPQYPEFSAKHLKFQWANSIYETESTKQLKQAANLSLIPVFLSQHFFWLAFILSAVHLYSVVDSVWPPTLLIQN